MTLCLTFHIKELPPIKLRVSAAILFTHLYLLKLPCAPSYMILKPIPATTRPNRTHSSTAQSGDGVKYTRCMYKKMKLHRSTIAFIYNCLLPVRDFPVLSK